MRSITLNRIALMTAMAAVLAVAPIAAAVESAPAKEAPAAEKTATTTQKPATTTEKAAAATQKPATTAEKTAAATEKTAQSSKTDKDFTLHGGTEGTDFRTLTVEGEDRVHIEFARPPLVVTLDPAKVPGLELGSARDVLDRTTPDLASPFTSLSAAERSRYLGKPWLRQYAMGAVAHFRPAVKDVERWKLIVADSRGQTVATFQGRGEPPKEIAWDGRNPSGAPVVPGLTYSYALEAYDKAGNKRNFVGQGFTVTSYRIDGPGGPTLLFSARDLTAGNEGAASGYAAGASRTAARPSPIVLEAASAWNQVNKPREPIRITAIARTRDTANALAAQVSPVFLAGILGDPARVQTVTEVQPDAPEGGVVRIAPAK